MEASRPVVVTDSRSPRFIKANSSLQQPLCTPPRQRDSRTTKSIVHSYHHSQGGWLKTHPGARTNNPSRPRSIPQSPSLDPADCRGASHFLEERMLPSFSWYRIEDFSNRILPPQISDSRSLRHSQKSPLDVSVADCGSACHLLCVPAALPVSSYPGVPPGIPRF